MLRHFLIVFASTALVTFIVYAGIARGRRPGNLFLVFLSLLLGTWAGGLWIMPFVESFWGIYWVSFLLVAAFYAGLIYLFLMPHRRPETRGEALRRARALGESDRMLRVTLIVVLVVSVVYVTYRYTGGSP